MKGDLIKLADGTWSIDVYGDFKPEKSKSMTPTSEQIAEQLARKCAAQVAVIEFNAKKLGHNLAHTYQQDALKLQILQSIPLVALLELRNSANSFVELLTVSRQQKLVDVLAALTTKLKQLGIDYHDTITN